MSTETRCLEGGFPDTNPGVSAGETAFRAACGRYTVDVVPIDTGILAVVGDGVGRPPVTAVITPAAAAAVLEQADRVDERGVSQTQAWPLAVDCDQEGREDV